MAEKTIHPMLKTLLEMGPIVAYFVLYSRMKDNVYTVGGTEYDGFIMVTAIFIPMILIATAALWKLTGTISKMQVMTAVLVVVFGGLSIWFNDDRFFKMKPTIIYLLFGGILGFGLLRGQSYLRSVMEQAMPLEDEGWMILTKRFTVLFFGLAVANEIVWRFTTTDTWVNFKTFGLTGLMFLFFMSQAKLFDHYGIDKDTGKENEAD